MGTRWNSGEIKRAEKQLSRREFLVLAGGAMGALALAGCGGEPESESQITGGTPTSEAQTGSETEKYPRHEVIATVFWLGEEATADNDFITNEETEWDPRPVERFGGVDNPTKRDENGLPGNFTPKHNPYYYALPASEYTDEGLRPGVRENSYWANETVPEDASLFKGRWAKIESGGQTVYAQWVDTGPSETEDYCYVFGQDQPRNTFNLRAGIDISPSAALALGIDGAGQVSWQFVDGVDVPDGLWRQFPLIESTNYWFHE